MEHAERRDADSGLLDEQRRLWIDTMSHARHDWLNDLQMIVGYVQLRKYDKLAGCVEKLKQKMAEESRTSKLEAPGLVEALLTARARIRRYAFAYRIDDKFALRGQGASAAEIAVRRLLEGFEEAAEKGAQGSDNELLCAFEGDEAEAAIVFSYRGAYSAGAMGRTIAELKKQLRLNAPACVLEAAFDADEATVKVRLSAAG